MAYYIKVNRKVAEHLGLENKRTKSADGNFLLWQADMSRFGLLTDLPGIARRIGGLVLRPQEAREEQDGKTMRPLPVAEDEAFRMKEDPGMLTGSAGNIDSAEDVSDANGEEDEA